MIRAEGRGMAKRIAIFCDGTWNRHDARQPTHVVQLAQMVAPTAADGMAQVVQYLIGVGTGRGTGMVARRIDRFMGGALGWGLAETIQEAYRALIFTYEPGDAVYIFGFSRGAYTARSLAGLIRSCGIPPAHHLDRVGEAFARYRARGQGGRRPDDGEMILFRSEFAPFTATSQVDWDWRLAHAPGPCHLLSIRYLGVWDTVGALGIPGHWGAAPWLNTGHQFHDTDLSRLVLAARHAVAVDERRRSFVPTLWSNLDPLNRGVLGLAAGVDLSTVPRNELKYREEWFSGTHGTLGGSGPVRGLSAAALAWIAQGVAAEGLELRPGTLVATKDGIDPLAPVNNQPQEDWMTRVMRAWGRDRQGPDAPRQVAPVTRARARADPAYRPGTLAKVMAALLHRD